MNANRKIMINLIFSLILIGSFQLAFSKPPKREFYEIKIYTLKSKEQEKTVEQYLQNAYLPAMHRMGNRGIGVFKPVAADTASFGKLIYVYTPLKSIDQVLTISEKLLHDIAYQSAGEAYLNANYKNPPYARYESILLQAFSDAPIMQFPQLKGPKKDRIYELRSYEGHTEKIYRNKVKMFNAGGEVVLFKNLNFNAVFYGEVVAGSHMPNLMYMTTFENKADRDAHWKSFVESPVWVKLKSEPEYQNNVSKNTQFFLFPTDYSDI
jgi:NIPSNAP